MRGIAARVQGVCKGAGVGLQAPERMGLAAADAAIPGRPLLRVDEAAAILAVSAESVRRLLDCGALTAVKVGTGGTRAHVRVTTESVRKLVGA